VLGLAALTLVLVEGHTWPWQRIVPVALVAACALAAFVAVQHRSVRPMLPLDLFGSRRLVGALLATFTMTFGIYGLLLVNSFAFQQQRGLSALATAVWFLPLPITYLALIPAANGLARRTSARTAMTAGLGLMAAGLLLYAAVGPTASVWLLELSLVLAGAGLALNTGPAVSLAMSAIPVQRSGLGAGVVNLSRLLGITVGVAVLGSAMAAIGGDLGVRVALVVGGLCQLAGAAAALGLARDSTVPALEKETTHA
jgi:hypothetical protein